MSRAVLLSKARDIMRGMREEATMVSITVRAGLINTGQWWRWTW